MSSSDDRRTGDTGTPDPLTSLPAPMTASATSRVTAVRARSRRSVLKAGVASVFAFDLKLARASAVAAVRVWPAKPSKVGK